MENKKKKINTAITRNIYEFSNQTGNIYETVAMLSKRSNQIAANQKKELNEKIKEFASNLDTMDDVFENREQIEIVRHYEQMPKPTLTATQEYLAGEIYYRNPAKEQPEEQKIEQMEDQIIAQESEKADKADKK